VPRLSQLHLGMPMVGKSAAIGAAAALLSASIAACAGKATPGSDNGASTDPGLWAEPLDAGPKCEYYPDDPNGCASGLYLCRGGALPTDTTPNIACFPAPYECGPFQTFSCIPFSRGTTCVPGPSCDLSFECTGADTPELGNSNLSCVKTLTALPQIVYCCSMRAPSPPTGGH
jgi:hypothetical protein